MDSVDEIDPVFSFLGNTVLEECVLKDAQMLDAVVNSGVVSQNVDEIQEVFPSSNSQFSSKNAVSDELQRMDTRRLNDDIYPIGVNPADDLAVVGYKDTLTGSALSSIDVRSLDEPVNVDRAAADESDRYIFVDVGIESFERCETIVYTGHVTEGNAHSQNKMECELENEKKGALLENDHSYGLSPNCKDSNHREIQVGATQQQHPRESSTTCLADVESVGMEDSSSTDSADTDIDIREIVVVGAKSPNIEPEPVLPAGNTVLNTGMMIEHHREEISSLPKGSTFHSGWKSISNNKSIKVCIMDKNTVNEYLTNSEKSTNSKPCSNENGQSRDTVANQIHTRSSFKVYVVSAKEASKQCPLCFKDCVSEVSLKKHLLWHLLIKNAGEQELLDPSGEEEFNLEYFCLSDFAETKSFDQLFAMCGPNVRSVESLYCMLCSRNFEFHHDLRMRMKYVAIDNCLVCTKCSMSFNNLMSLEIHLRQHFGSSPFGCCCCEEVFSDVLQLKSHVVMHSFHLYACCLQCQYCPMIFFSKADKMKHETDHCEISQGMQLVGKARNAIADIGSGCNSRDVSTFRKTLPDCRNPVGLGEKISSYRKDEASVQNAKVMMQSELRALAGVLAFNKEILTLMRRNLGLSPKPTPLIKDLDAQQTVYKQVISSSYGSILESVDCRKHWCNCCGMSFTDIDELCMHKDERHEAPKLFSCDNCARFFGSFCALAKHRTTHYENLSCQCPVCFTYFKYRFDMSQHLKVHFADRLRRCPECGAMYASQSYFIEHLEMHAALRSFLHECRECSLKFTSRMLLRRHMRLKHQRRWSRECSVCGRLFSKQSIWLVHMKGHMRNKFRKCLKGMDLYKPYLSLQKVSKTGPCVA